MREMPEVRHPLPLSNSGFQELIHVLWQAFEIETGLDRSGRGKHFLCSSPSGAPHRCIMQHFDNLATSYTLI